MAASDSFASGTWFVREGREDEFVARWTEFAQWTRDNAEGFREANLLRSAKDPRRFLSVAHWDDDSAQARWRSLPGFLEKLGACRELCDDAQTGRFWRVASVAGRREPTRG
jgi:heme-degrading monooxygenase HmoA